MKPFPIKYGTMKKPRYCCPVCLRTIKKKQKFCVHCFVKNGKLREFEWESDQMKSLEIINELINDLCTNSLPEKES